MKREKKENRILKQYRQGTNAIRLQIFLLGFIALIAVSYAIMCTVGMKIQDESTIKEYLGNYLEQRTNVLHTEIRTKQTALNNLKEAFEENAVTEDTKCFLERKKNEYGFDFIALYDKQSGNLSFAGAIPDEAGLNRIEENSELQQGLQNKQCEVGIEDTTVIYVADLYSGEEKTGVLWAGTQTDKIENLVATEGFQESGSSYILDKDSRILWSAKAKDNTKLWAYVNEQTTNTKLTDYVELMREHFEKNKAGNFRFTYLGTKTYYLSYMPVGINGWMIAAIAPSSLFTGFSDAYVARMLVSFGVVCIVFGCLFVLLFKSYNEKEKRLEKMAFLDEVTGGLNKIEFRMKYEELCRRGIADQYAMVLMDCVDFKMINETLGARNGDKMLKYFYSVITESLSKEQEEFAARTEMDHFFLCLREKEPQMICQRMEKIIRNINTFQNTELPKHQVMFRQGVSLIENNETDITVVQDQARAALKNQESGQKEKCGFYDASVAQKIQKERELDRLFEESLEKNYFHVYMQPKVSLKRKKVEGAEALVRWKYPGKELMSPAEFIPLLERNGKIRMLEKYIFEKVCSWLSRRKEEGKELFPISVNLSRIHFMHENFLMDYIRITEKYKVSPSLIEFEITETIFLDQMNLQKAKAGIFLMHAYGFKCAMDDFGVGYSSLTLLKEITIDVLKLDRSFFLDLKNQRAQDVITCIVELAQKLKIKTVVEGIETQEQIEYLKKMNCDIVQGYYYSRPLPIREFEKWIGEFYFEGYETRGTI